MHDVLRNNNNIYNISSLDSKNVGATPKYYDSNIWHTRCLKNIICSNISFRSMKNSANSKLNKLELTSNTIRSKKLLWRIIFEILDLGMFPVH